MLIILSLSSCVTNYPKNIMDPPWIPAEPVMSESEAANLPDQDTIVPVQHSPREGAGHSSVCDIGDLTLYLFPGIKPRGLFVFLKYQLVSNLIVPVPHISNIMGLEASLYRLKQIAP